MRQPSYIFWPEPVSRGMLYALHFKLHIKILVVQIDAGA